MAELSACPDDNVIAEHAAQRLPAAQAQELTAHLRECQECRLAWQAAREEPVVALGKVEQHAPADLLRQRLEEDAPQRELQAVTLLAVIGGLGAGAVVAINMMQGRAFSAAGVPPALACAWCVALRFALKRGWYWRHLPVVNVIVESSMPFLAMVALAVARGPEVMIQSLFPYIWAGLIVFSAYRASPRLSAAAGVMAAAQGFVLYAAFPAASDTVLPVPWTRASVAAVLLLLCGLAAAVTARQLLAKADEALRAAREQDLMGKYVLEHRLGAGGMAEVFRATYCPEGGFRKTVAVKRVLPELGDDERFAGAFLEEARLGALLSHPNVVQVHDCGKFKGSFILAMEWVDGCSLGEVLRACGALPVPAVLHLGIELCSALEYIHGRCDHDGQPLHLVHRDLNPPNVLLSKIGEVKLSDFGVASAAPRQVIRARDAFYGKDGFAPPEQLAGTKIDPRTDLFALGLTLREALAGRRLKLDALEALRPEVPLLLITLLEALEAQDPSGRPPSARVVRDVLLSILNASAAWQLGREQLVQSVATTRLGPRPSFSSSSGRAAGSGW